jgi:DNA-binding transcriptional MerR regulator
MREATYSSRDVAQTAGVPYRTLMRWVEAGLLRPKGYTGRQRVAVSWTAKDVREAVILAGLRACQLSLQQVRQVLRYLRKIGQNPLSSGTFLVLVNRRGKPHELVKLCDGGQALNLMKNGRGQLMLPLWPRPLPRRRVD